MDDTVREFIHNAIFKFWRKLSSVISGLLYKETVKENVYIYMDFRYLLSV